MENKKFCCNKNRAEEIVDWLFAAISDHRRRDPDAWAEWVEYVEKHLDAVGRVGDQ